jgi:hypothetical protein
MMPKEISAIRSDNAADAKQTRLDKLTEKSFRGNNSVGIRVSAEQISAIGAVARVAEISPPGPCSSWIAGLDKSALG